MDHEPEDGHGRHKADAEKATPSADGAGKAEPAAPESAPDKTAATPDPAKKSRGGSKKKKR